jgi:hypothetical protein
MPKPSADCVVNASVTTSDNTRGNRSANAAITIDPPTRYSATFKGASASAARPIHWMPPRITAATTTASAMPTSQVGVPNTALTASAIEFGCVNGVVVSTATPPTRA